MKFQIGSKWVGQGEPVFVVAEACSNWVGEDLDEGHKKALRLIEGAAKAGADAIKFQLLRADKLYVPGELREKVRRYELPCEWLPELSNRAHELGLAFICTPLYLGAVGELLPYVDAYKIASGDMLWFPLWEDVIIKTLTPIIVSTGAATQSEVTELQTWLDSFALPGYSVMMLHCVSAYPAHSWIMNLRAMPQTGWLFGLSDHSCDPMVASMAVALGASIIEVHFAQSDSDVEAWHSLIGVEGLGAYVRLIRRAERILGDGVKRPMPCEESERLWARRGKDGLRPKEEVR